MGRAVFTTMGAGAGVGAVIKAGVGAMTGSWEEYMTTPGWGPATSWTTGWEGAGVALITMGGGGA